MGNLAPKTGAFTCVRILHHLFLDAASFRNPDLLPHFGRGLEIEKTLPSLSSEALSPVLDDGAALENFRDAVGAVFLTGLEVEEVPLANPEVELVVCGILVARDGFAGDRVERQTENTNREPAKPRGWANS